jgi:hypothetical protein
MLMTYKEETIEAYEKEIGKVNQSYKRLAATMVVSLVLLLMLLAAYHI